MLTTKSKVSEKKKVEKKVSRKTLTMEFKALEVGESAPKEGKSASKV